MIKHEQMKNKKRGIAVSMVVAMGTVLSILIFGVMRFSSNEMHFTAQAAFQKRAVMLAYSGISIAEMALAKGRWYQPPFRPFNKAKAAFNGTLSDQELADWRKQNLVNRPNFSELELEPEGWGNGTIRIFFHEIPINGVDLTKNSLYARFKLEKADLLDHIKVYSIGEYRGERVMVYGKYIMSPSPLFNSAEIDLASSTMQTVTEHRVIVEPLELVKEIIGIEKPLKHGKIIKVCKKAGEKVTPNDVLFINGDADTSKGWQATQQGQPKAAVYGKIKSMINPMTGREWQVGDEFHLPCEMAVIEEDSSVGTDIPSQTLKRMVMVMRIPKEMYARASLKVGTKDTYRVLGKIADYTREVARKYAQNVANKKVFEEELPEVFAQRFPSSGLFGTKVSDKRIVEVLDGIAPLPEIGYNAAGNAFMVNMLKNWRPRGFAIDSDELNTISRLPSFTLGVPETDPSPRESLKDLFAICQQFSEWKMSRPRGSIGKPDTLPLLSVWKPVGEVDSNGLPNVHPLRKTWEVFEKSLAREIRHQLFPGKENINKKPPYVFNRENCDNPTAEFLSFRDFKGPYNPYANSGQKGYTKMLDTAGPQEFIRRLAVMETAAKKLKLTFMSWVPQQDWSFQDMVNSYLWGEMGQVSSGNFEPGDYWPWWGDQRQYYKDMNGFNYPFAEIKYRDSYGKSTFCAKSWPDQLRQPVSRKGHPGAKRANLANYSAEELAKILVEEVDVPYTYELKFRSGQGIKTRVDYLLDYFRKFYDEPELSPDSKRLRTTDDQSDVPQVPPLPELLGASYDGLSS